MVQYLFAAYSLGGDQVPARLEGVVRGWQETILGIAKEEMGHLVTVQNLLTLLGAPLTFVREDYPWGSDFYPFTLALQRLTARSLAQYVCAESPTDWSGPEADDIRRLAKGQSDVPVNRVGELYALITRILGNADLVADNAFHGETLAFQASWDEWGRGYAGGARGVGAGTVDGLPAPELLIERVRDRLPAAHVRRPRGSSVSPNVRPVTVHDNVHKLRCDKAERKAKVNSGG